MVQLECYYGYLELSRQHSEVAYSEDELKIIMAHSFQGGEINQTELSYYEEYLYF